MITYKIEFKEYGNHWMETTYSTPTPVSRKYLIDFFGLLECEDYKISEEK